MVQVTEYDWTKVDEYRAAAEAHAATAPSYADINARISEAKKALGLKGDIKAMPGYVSGFGDDGSAAAAAGGRGGDVAAAVDPVKAAEAAERTAARKRQRQEANQKRTDRLAQLPKEQWPVGLAPFDRK